MALSPRVRRLRWAAPFAVAAVIALIVAIPGLSSAQTPNLAPLTPAQLIAKVEQSNVKAFSGTINLNTNLGIPNLSELNNATSGGNHGPSGFSPTDLLSGTHQALVWFDGADKNRVDLLQSMAETDVIHNGQDVWTWDSTSKAVTHRTLTEKSNSDTGGTSPAEAVKTPQQVADDLLAQITPTTSVSVGAPTVVAQQDAYQLILAPHSAASTIDHVAIAVDSATGVPLQVQLFAKGQTAAAVTVGFGQIDYATPDVSEFNFTPPPGSTVNAPAATTRHSAFGRVRAADAAPQPATQTVTGPEQTTTVGQDWATVEIIRNVQIPPQYSDYLKAGTPVTGGTLLESSLVNVLVTNDGRVAVGAVNASTLEAAVAATP